MKLPSLVKERVGVEGFKLSLHPFLHDVIMLIMRCITVLTTTTTEFGGSSSSATVPVVVVLLLLLLLAVAAVVVSLVIWKYRKGVKKSSDLSAFGL